MGRGIENGTEERFCFENSVVLDEGRGVVSEEHALWRMFGT